MEDSSAPRRSGSGYKPHPLATLPHTLDPASYDWPPEKRRAEAERLAIRARLKREFLLRLNDPSRNKLIDDPAVNRWVYARTHNVYPTASVTLKTSIMGLFFGIGPLVFWYYVFKTDRDNREKRRREGKLDEPLHTFY